MHKIMGSLFRGMMSAHVWVYRKTGGKRFNMGGRLLLLTTTGRKSGQERTNPLVFIEHEGALLVACSAGGGPHNPGWYYNAKANPEVQVQVGPEVKTMQARVVDDDPERGELYQQFIDADKRFAGYAEKAGRKIPVIALEPAA